MGHIWGHGVAITMRGSSMEKRPRCCSTEPRAMQYPLQSPVGSQAQSWAQGSVPQTDVWKDMKRGSVNTGHARHQPLTTAFCGGAINHTGERTTQPAADPEVKGDCPLGILGVSSRMVTKTSVGAGEMARQLRAWTALQEVMGSNPSNHMVTHNYLE